MKNVLFIYRQTDSLYVEREDRDTTHSETVQENQRQIAPRSKDGHGEAWGGAMESFIAVFTQTHNPGGGVVLV